MNEKEKGKRARVVDLEETDTEDEYDKPDWILITKAEGEASAALKHGKKKKIQQGYKTYDLEENLAHSRDFATLRQKHKDGMYQTLEQFKNDVYNLLKRALESNSPDSIPYQQMIRYFSSFTGGQDAGLSSSPTEQRRNTYKPEDNASHEIAQMAFQSVELVYTYDLGENLSVPRDFATLRQKHKDGMYQTLEQFKNDVYNLLKRALESNSPDSIPYQQAKYLLDQADLIFRSLRTNPIYAEKELEAWHQKYFQYKKKAVRFENSRTIFSVEILESRLRPRVACSMKQSSKDNEGAPSRRAQSLGTKKKTKKRSSSKPRGGRPSVNLDGAQDAGLSSSLTEQRRNTYKPEDNVSHEIAQMAFQPVELVYQSNSRSYEESMRNFVKDAGPMAKMAAEQKIQELAERNQAYQASNYQALTNPGMSSQIPPFRNWSENIQFGANPTSISLATTSNLPTSSASLRQSNRYAAIFESSTSLIHGTNFEDFNSVQGGSSESVLGVNSQLLYGQGSQAIYPSYASSLTTGSTTQKDMSSELKQPEFLQTNIFNMSPNSSQALDDHFGVDTRLLSGKGMQPLDGYFGVNSQLHFGEGMQALYPSYASSIAPGLMIQINRSSELKQPEFFPGSVFNTAPSSREALLGGNSQLLTGKGKKVAYPSNANSVTVGLMSQTSSSFELKQPECSQGSISNIAPSSLENLEGVIGGNSQLLSGEGNQANDVYNLLKKALESNRWDETEIGLLILLMQRFADLLFNPLTTETDCLLLQAKYLLDQADLIFRSLRTNPIYAEKELEAWHQKYFQYKKKAVRFENSTAIFSVEILESRLRPKVASSMKQNSKDNDGAPSRRVQSLGTKNTKKRRSSKLRDGRPSVNLDGKEEISTSTTMKKPGFSPNHP
ncbi:hypothetical protein J5N97_003925 [Dioscorea zingiberensis]|uniref:Bromo domain-containing protein n=1 Tax=Dioscorea zingiberensis TaxID=325984 RepID=A0A9D5D6T8_9LILI|nr:hypothetical protein J5N97_003925 [Dioscorea zingiberensis]